MQRLRTDEKPFDQKVKDEKATTWLIPKLVGEVKFTDAASRLPGVAHRQKGA